jgi:ketosteroid isomerase-like protein
MKTRPLLALILLAPAVTVAQGELLSPADTVAAFHSAMADGNEPGVLALLAPQVTIFESGGAELSRDAYASHHLGADMQFTQAMERTVVDQQVGTYGDGAWVATRSETRGTFRDKELDLVGTETMILERDGADWRILHIHWSSHPRSSGH